MIQSKKQHLEKHTHKAETGDRPEIIINKETLQHLAPIGLKNTDIVKTFIIRILAACWIKFRQLFNVIWELEDDNETTQTLHELQ